MLSSHEHTIARIVIITLLGIWAQPLLVVRNSGVSWIKGLLPWVAIGSGQDRLVLTEQGLNETDPFNEQANFMIHSPPDRRFNSSGPV